MPPRKFEEQPEGSFQNQIAFILSPGAIYFRNILPPGQVEAFDAFIHNHEESVSIADIFRRSFEDPELKVVRENFRIVLQKITKYLEFLESKGGVNAFESNPYFNIETAPYFWRETLVGEKGQTEYDISDENDPAINEFIEFKINFNNEKSKLVGEELSGLERKIFDLLIVNTQYPNIERILNIDTVTVSRIAGKIKLKIESNFQSTNQMIIEFLQLDPSLRKVLLLAIQQIDAEEMANTLQTSLPAIYTSLNRLRAVYGEIISIPRSNRFDIVSIDKSEIPSNRNFIPANGLLIERENVETIVNNYLSNPDSQYKAAIRKLHEVGVDGLLKLYFLLTEVPDKSLCALLTGLSEGYIKEIVAELKQLLLPTGHSELKTKDYEHWVEITSNGYKFLLSDLDLKIIEVIRQQQYSGRLSTHSIAEKLEESPSTIKSRVNKMYKWLKVSNLVSIVEAMDNTREG